MSKDAAKDKAAAAPSSAAKNVAAEAAKVDKSTLEHVTPTENSVVTQMKTQNAIKKADKTKMKHVNAPTGALTDEQKKAFKEDQASKKVAAKK
jgi:hypothetical protein